MSEPSEWASHQSPCVSHSQHFHRESLCISSTMLHCSGTLYSPDSPTPQDRKLSCRTTQLQSHTAAEGQTGCLLILFIAQTCLWSASSCGLSCAAGFQVKSREGDWSCVSLCPCEMKMRAWWQWVMLLFVCPQSPEARSLWLSLEQWLLLWEAPSPSDVPPVRVWATIAI